MATPEDMESAAERNDGIARENAAKALGYLVSAGFVHIKYRFPIEVIERRIDDRTMIGWDLGFLGPWLPDWQFIRSPDGNTTVSPIAIELRDKWGDFQTTAFLHVMATHLSEAQIGGQPTTYAELVQIGVNPLHEPAAISTFSRRDWETG